jgi:tetratricopeptide (TPR) repeat protein
MVGPTHVILAISICALATQAAQANQGEPAPVLPPTAARPLEAALGDRGLGPGLALQTATLNRDHVVVTFGKGDDAPTRLTVTLRHPNAAEGAVHVGPAFSIHAQDQPKALVAKLAKRLQSLERATFWYTPQAPVSKPGPKAEPEEPEGQEDAEDALRLALHAARIDDKDLAVARLDAMESDARLRAAAGLDLAEAWYRVGVPERGVAAAEHFINTVSFLEPMDAIRGGVLRGQALPLAELRAALAGVQHGCAVGSLGSSMDAVGRQADAHLLLGELFTDGGCMEAALERIAWYVAAHDFPQADALSQALIERFPESEEAIGRRAQVLMALKRPLDAVGLLEPVVWKNPHSGLLSALLGVYNRVSDDAWQDAKRAEIVAKSAADADDHTAAFYAGVLLHYDGQFAASNLKLEPLLETFGEQPRLFIYLGMNAFNLGDTPKAFALLRRGEALRAPDPDIYYCRAEVNRFTDPPAAAEDLRRYLAQTRGSPTSNPKKRARVEAMARTLAACIAAGGPIPCPGPWEHPYGHPSNEPAPEPGGTASIPAWWAVVLVLLLAGAGLLWRRRSASTAP